VWSAESNAQSTMRYGIDELVHESVVDLNNSRRMLPPTLMSFPEMYGPLEVVCSRSGWRSI